LSHNSLEQLPDALAHIYSLDTLNLSYNNLLNVYEAPTCLGNITTLNLSHNPLESTRGLEKLWSLRSLDLTFNLIRSADDICEISGLPELEEIRVAGNPFCSDEKVHLI
jgi:Leucine-rich repeat (LRR) protein